eukprot:NODE_442_length_7350_cov_0.498552.p4 type:complete len:261 gc:universal NODE_442_length_7350_cov_0.498552:2192-1410(-)
MILKSHLLKIYKVNRLSELGQNFIFDKQFCKSLLESIPNPVAKRICEVGSGPGVFTEALEELNPKELLLFEKDTRLKGLLEGKNVIWGDFLNVEKPSSNYPTWVVGNLPFNISTRILFCNLRDMYYNSGLNPEGLLFMFQKEVGDRIIAKVGSRMRLRLSIMSQLYTDVKLIKYVDKSNFSPRPKVDGAMILFTRKKNILSLPDFDEMEKFVQILCKNPRKTIKLKPFEEKRVHQLEVENISELFYSKKELLEQKKKNDN